MEPWPRPFRWFALLVLALCALPAVVMFASPAETVSKDEARALAQWPSPPANLGEAIAWPRKVDAYLGDHFGFRRDMVKGEARDRMRLGIAGNGTVVRGKDGQLFLRSTLVWATGEELDAPGAAAYADEICRIGGELNARGARMVFALAPHASTIYPENAPIGVTYRTPTRYDLVTDQTRRCGVATVDLRPPLKAAKPQGKLYMLYDTHWTDRASLAAFNALVGGLGLDWGLDPATATWKPTSVPSGDLRRLQGLGERSETIDLLILPPAVRTETWDDLKIEGRPSPFVEYAGGAGPRVLIIGDSFSQRFMPPLFRRHASAVAWTHFAHCQFNHAVIERFQPDIVLVLSSEQVAYCGAAADIAAAP